MVVAAATTAAPTTTVACVCFSYLHARHTPSKRQSQFQQLRRDSILRMFLLILKKMKSGDETPLLVDTLSMRMRILLSGKRKQQMHDGNHTEKKNTLTRGTTHGRGDGVRRDRTNPIHFVVSHISFYGACMYRVCESRLFFACSFHFLCCHYCCCSTWIYDKRWRAKVPCVSVSYAGENIKFIMEH